MIFPCFQLKTKENLYACLSSKQITDSFSLSPYEIRKPQRKNTLFLQSLSLGSTFRTLTTFIFPSQS